MRVLKANPAYIKCAHHGTRLVTPNTTEGCTHLNNASVQYEYDTCSTPLPVFQHKDENVRHRTRYRLYGIPLDRPKRRSRQRSVATAIVYNSLQESSDFRGYSVWSLSSIVISQPIGI